MSEEKWIQHCSHREHNLKEVYSNSKFKCQVCNYEGEAKRYRCNPCNFEIHEICGEAPESLFSFTHPEHQLSLRPNLSPLNKCRLCRGMITAMVYRCEVEGCKFFLHPTCSLLPELSENHPSHPPHPLKLCSLNPNGCHVCKKECEQWRYHCEACDVHIHVECLVSNATTTTTTVGTTSARHQLGRLWTHIKQLADVVENAKDLMEAGKDLMEAGKEAGKDLMEAGKEAGKDLMEAGKDLMEPAKDLIEPAKDLFKAAIETIYE